MFAAIDGLYVEAGLFGDIDKLNAERGPVTGEATPLGAERAGAS